MVVAENDCNFSNINYFFPLSVVSKEQVKIPRKYAQELASDLNYNSPALPHQINAYTSRRACRTPYT